MAKPMPFSARFILTLQLVLLPMALGFLTLLAWAFRNGKFEPMFMLVFLALFAFEAFLGRALFRAGRWDREMEIRQASMSRWPIAREFHMDVEEAKNHPRPEVLLNYSLYPELLTKAQFEDTGIHIVVCGHCSSQIEHTQNDADYYRNMMKAKPCDS